VEASAGGGVGVYQVGGKGRAALYSVNTKETYQRDLLKRPTKET
jgi:hypothetical protein